MNARPLFAMQCFVMQQTTGAHGKLQQTVQTAGCTGFKGLIQHAQTVNCCGVTCREDPACHVKCLYTSGEGSHASSGMQLVSIIPAEAKHSLLVAVPWAAFGSRCCHYDTLWYSLLCKASKCLSQGQSHAKGTARQNEASSQTLVQDPLQDT